MQHKILAWFVGFLPIIVIFGASYFKYLDTVNAATIDVFTWNVYPNAAVVSAAGLNSGVYLLVCVFGFMLQLVLAIAFIVGWVALAQHIYDNPKYKIW